MTSQKPNYPNRVILHCSATPDFVEQDKDFDRFGLADIKRWHIERGFGGVGYHFIVRRTGVIELGRPLELQGAHTLGHNTNSIGICYVGSRRPTPRQITSILNLYSVIYNDYGVRYSNWFGHYEFTVMKECPGFSMDIFRKLLDLYHAVTIKDG